MADTVFDQADSTSETAQAQHMQANDAPVDVNLNAVVARSQALTIDALGKGFAANQDRRDKIADAGLGSEIRKQTVGT